MASTKITKFSISFLKPGILWRRFLTCKLTTQYIKVLSKRKLHFRICAFLLLGLESLTPGLKQFAQAFCFALAQAMRLSFHEFARFFLLGSVALVALGRELLAAWFSLPRPRSPFMAATRITSSIHATYSISALSGCTRTVNQPTSRTTSR